MNRKKERLMIPISFPNSITSVVNKFTREKSTDKLLQWSSKVHMKPGVELIDAGPRPVAVMRAHLSALVTHRKPEGGTLYMKAR